MMIAATVDAFYVGKLGTEELAALSLIFPVFMILTGVAMGLGIGATSVVSRTLGRGDRAKALEIGTHTLLLILIIVCVLEVLGFLLLEQLFRLLGTDTALMPMVTVYTQILLLSLPFFAIPMVGGMMLRAMGDVKTAAITMVAGAGVQIAVAPILIWGIGSWEGWGFYGSAWSFFVSRFLLFFYAAYEFHRFGLFRHPGRWREIVSSWVEILRLGVSSMTSQLIMPISMGILLALLATYGNAVIAAFGVVSRIEGLALMVLMALASSLGPIVGQNFGAKQFDRVSSALKFSYGFSLVYGVTIAVVLYFLADPLAALFRDDAAVVSVAVEYLRIVPITFCIAGLGMLSGTLFVAYGEALPSFLLSIARSIAVLIPLVILFREFFGYVGVFIGIASSNVIVGLLGFLWLIMRTRTHRERVELASEDENPQELERKVETA